jgi:hypothetical protein
MDYLLKVLFKMVLIIHRYQLFSPSERSDIRYTEMPSFCQNVINLVVSLSPRRGPGLFMNVAMWKHGTFDN